MTAFRDLREAVLQGNLALPALGLVKLTSGNASQIDRNRGVFGIKPSGVSYETMTAQDIVIVDLDGEVVEGERGPSTDTPTHLALYRRFEEIGAVVHTHSTWATVWAQAQREIPLYGTTHADLCAEPIPVTRALSEVEISEGYERNTGAVLIEAIGSVGPARLPCALVRGHAPFTWGPTVAKAVEVSVTLEEVARMAFLTATLEPSAPSLDAALRRKHYERRHGPRAYYGQA
ncbi:MAG TPA: L-ribulose-5-phosphate 4-epimerase AraD [Solirubrobacteraceae bacterium]|jgi:L-ribulose-5-phosphate 4-epimerase|nr:L-ribulose-5-phosphate 4-epimerase AraD [Solirubrobacteraceae bacterium]